MLVAGFTVACVVGACLATPAGAQEPMRGVALVIGNSEYEHLAPLPNPENDARAVEDLLDDLGFETEMSTDRDARRLARDLEDFVEDAEGADVAIVYYSGHGIEAGGENFLVPVDADLSALDEAGEKLVPLSALLDRLKASVPVTIIMLDACRDNPFPPGSSVRLSADVAPVPMGTGGLGETRGASRLGAATSQPADDLGSVIAFAAEPGKVALDGTPGGNSPYTSAILRHFDTMAGEEFGIVMRMVAEEVYLKTGGRQRPWVNESLRRLLYFGTRIDAPEGVEGDILRERRQLLVTISTLPDAERRTVERIAGEGGVPMDALYGMLRALGTDAPSDPGELERLLREQSARIEEMRREQDTIKATDPEIARLSELAENAVAEGALETALALHEQAKARVREVESTVAQAEADIAARRKEFANVYAASGRANYMSFRYEEAAADYEQAFLQVERWDDWAAWSHRGNQAVALRDSGWRTGAIDSLRRSVEIAEEVVRLSERLPDRADWAMSQMFHGNVLLSLGQREKNVDMLSDATRAYEEALAVYTEDNLTAGGVDRFDVLHNLAGTYVQIAALGHDAEGYRNGISRFRELADMVSRADDALVWARTVTSMGSAMNDLARLEDDVDGFRAAADILEQALEARAGASPEERFDTLKPLAIAYSEIGNRTEDVGLLEKAEGMYDQSLDLADRGRAPMDWADLQHASSLNAHMIGLRRQDPAYYQRAVEGYRRALEVYSRDTIPHIWSATKTALGGALNDLGRARKDPALLRDALVQYDEALEIIPREREPAEWADNASRAADVARNLAEQERDIDGLMAALDRHAAALDFARGKNLREEREMRRRVTWLADTNVRVEALGDADNLRILRRARDILDDGRFPGARAYVETALGRALYAQGGADGMRAAIDAYRSALVPEARESSWDSYRNTQVNLALAHIELNKVAPDPQHLRDAVPLLEDYLGAPSGPDDRRRQQRRLGDALTSLADGGEPALYRRAAEVWRALADDTPDGADPLDRAWVQESLGSTLQNLVAYGQADDAAASSREALDAYAAALAIYTPETARDAWARVAENRADLLHVHGGQTADVALLREADRLYAELAARTEAGSPDARRIRLSHAALLTTLAPHEPRDAHLDRAIGLFAAELGERAERATPAEWANVVTYGNALVQRGLPRRERAFFDRAATVLSTLPANAEVSSGERAWMLSSQADAWLMSSYYSDDLALMRRSLAAYEQVAEIYRADVPAYLVNMSASVAQARALLGEKTGDREMIAQAVQEFQAVIGEVQQESQAQLWAFVANGLAFGHAHLARAGGDGDLDEAVRLGRATIDYYRSQPGMEIETADAQDTLCVALTEMGSRRRDRAIAAEALATCDSAATVYQSRGIENLELRSNRTRAADLAASLR